MGCSLAPGLCKHWHALASGDSSLLWDQHHIPYLAYYRWLNIPTMSDAH